MKSPFVLIYNHRQKLFFLPYRAIWGWLLLRNLSFEKETKLVVFWGVH
jgi:hypothetical protein